MKGLTCRCKETGRVHHKGLDRGADKEELVGELPLEKVIRKLSENACHLRCEGRCYSAGLARYISPIYIIDIYIYRIYIRYFSLKISDIFDIFNFYRVFKNIFKCDTL